MWQQNYEPVGGSLAWSALVASIPIAVLFFMLGVWRKPSWIAALTALGVAFALALGAYGMPASLALMAALTGAAYGLFPIAWIVFSSILLYRLAVDTGKFEIIKDSVGGLTTDRRLQALFIGFSFGAFIEGAAGFGAPVAVAGAMLAGLGFSPFYAAGICLMANTAPVAFGSIGIPVTTLAGITGLPVLLLSAMVGRLCALISADHPHLPGGRHGGVAKNPRGAAGRRRVRGVVCRGAVLRVELRRPRTDRHSQRAQLHRLDGAGPEVLEAADDLPARGGHAGDRRRPIVTPPSQLFAAWLPYLLLVLFVVTWGEASVKKSDRRVHERNAARVFAKKPHDPQRADGARSAQPDHAGAAGGPSARHPTPRSTPSIG